MKTGFTYKGIHSSTYGITVKTQDRPIIPNVKAKTYSPLYMDGQYNFSVANPYSREFYEERTFTMVLQIHGDNLTVLQMQMNRIAVWLLGSGDLIFDDTPNVKWSARCDNSISFAPELKGKKAVITVQFTVSPFADGIISSLDEITLDTDMVLDWNMPLDLPSYYTHTISIPADDTHDWVNIPIPNYGGRPIRPIITLSAPEGMAIQNAYVTNVDLKYSDNELIINCGRLNNMVIDFNLQKVTSNGVISSVSGDFFELSGTNPILQMDLYVVNNTSSVVDYTMTIDFTPSVVWDLDFDSVNWGDDDA